jgi:hypothetical protein
VLLRIVGGIRAALYPEQRTGPARIDTGAELSSRRLPVRYLMTLDGGGPEADERTYAEMGRFIEELSAAGVLLATGGLDLNRTHMVASGGKVTLVDGPYAEAKETIVSFALLEVGSRAELTPLVERFWAIVGDGQGDIRQVFGP